MKKYLLPETGNFYKANLHCHTTGSDGKKSPEEVRELYRSMGYSVVAYTDHDVFFDRSELRTPDFLPLNGIEVEFYAPRTPESLKKIGCVHLCLIALEEDNLLTPLYHRTKYVKYNEEEARRKMRFDEAEPDFERGWGTEEINAAIALAKKKGFFVTYNHPEWSFEDETRLVQYRGLDAIEIFNSGSVALGYGDNTPAHYRALARHGIRLYPIAADDNHNPRPLGDRRSDCGLGWVQIKAEKLEYRTVTRALQNGDFYASTGPEIHSLWTEDGTVHVTCSPADEVSISYIGGGYRRLIAGTGAEDPKGFHRYSGKESVTEASFTLEPICGAFRVEVHDKHRRTASTRYYYPQEW